jgi:acyl carrier protein
MKNLEKYTGLFTQTFGIDAAKTAGLTYQAIPEWDSVGHMTLMAAIEDAFDILLDTDDIIDFSSFEKGQEILGKYNVSFE